MSDNEVVFTGWRVGFNKVAFTKLVCEMTGCSLALARDLLHTFLPARQHTADGPFMSYQRATLTLPSRAAALTLIDRASALGAVCAMEGVDGETMGR